MDEKIQDMRLKQVNLITSNLSKGFFSNQIDDRYLDDLENRFKDIRGRLVRESQIICRDRLTTIAINQFREGGYFYPTTKKSLLIAQLQKKK